MAGILLQILVGVGTKLLTETFLSHLIVHSLRGLTAKSTSPIPAEMVQDLADALGVK